MARFANRDFEERIKLKISPIGINTANQYIAFIINDVNGYNILASRFVVVI